MKVLWTIPLLLAGALAADETTDRRAIEGVIEQLNRPGEEHASLFVEGTDAAAELHRLDRAGCHLREVSRPWSEVTPPRFTRPTVQFIAPEVAVADVEYVQYGSVMAVVRTPVVVILKREPAGWKIATLRVMSECPGAVRIVPAGR